MKPLHVAALQSNIVWEDKAQNLAQFSKMISTIPKEKQVVFLPEMFATGFSMNIDLAEPMDGKIVNWMSETAKENGKILCGSVMIKEEQHIYNRLIWMLPNGMWHYYDKRHLFAFGEEDTLFTPGDSRVLVQANGWKICLMVCYDLRFPVWCRQQASSPYDVLVFIANWPERRCLAWKILLQARAIENQCYVIGVNRVGIDGQGINHSGDSLIIDPLGNIIQAAPFGESFQISAILDPTLLQNTRLHFPFLKDADAFIMA